MRPSDICHWRRISWKDWISARDLQTHKSRLCSNTRPCAKDRITLESVLIVYINVRRQNAHSAAVASDGNVLGLCVVPALVARISVYCLSTVSVEIAKNCSHYDPTIQAFNWVSKNIRH